MNVIFNCLHCQQELEGEDTWAGEIIECPSCKKEVIVPGAAGPAVSVSMEETAPSPSQSSPEPSVPAASAESVVEADFVFKPTGGTSDEIRKPFVRSFEAVAKGDKKVAIKTVRREDCRKDGNDCFDEVVSGFLQQIAHEDLISISPIHYSYPGKEPGHIFEDYGVVIVFKQ
ncbi:MAG: hypothetical protein EXS19_02570 [Pedosphaera sp.]|nr:hypothetical protein [Pedosphaera sp.]